ncbi:MAG: hypothetical protein GXO69_00495 [Acidobacteria bacterium]|nr:hypothetical protein [Acidobacteriota bacterium]
MGFFLFVPTIDPGNLKIPDEQLSRLSKDTGLDTATLKNTFYGSGIACIRAHSNREPVEKLAEALSYHNIPNLFTRMEDFTGIPVLKAKKLIAQVNGIEIVTDKGQFSIGYNQPMAIASNIKWSRDSIQRSVMKAEQFVIASADYAFTFQAKTVTVENVPGLSNYSRTHNTALFLENLFKNGEELYVDSSFQRLQSVLRGGFPRYAQFLSKAIHSGFLKADFPEELLTEHKPEKRALPSYNHRIYRGLDLYRHRYLQNFRTIELKHTSIAWLLFLILAYSGIRLYSTPLVAAAFGILSLSLNIRFFQLYRLKNLVQDIPLSKLRSVSAGFVEVMGRIHGRNRFISPVSGAECVYFRYTREQLINSRDGNHWKTVEIGEAFSEDCYLDDGTGIISLNLKNANFSISSKETVYRSYDELNSGLVPVPGIHQTRYREEYIQDGRTVYVMGTATPVNPLRRFGEYLREIKKDKNRLLRFDLDGNGIIDESEWQAALPKLRQEFLSRYMDKGQSFSLMIDYNKDFPVFLISDQPEEKLLKKLKWKVPATLALGFLTFVIFLILLVSIIGG